MGKQHPLGIYFSKTMEFTCKDLVVGIQFNLTKSVGFRFGFRSYGVIWRLIASSEKNNIEKW
jgi:hypothetical protein